MYKFGKKCKKKEKMFENTSKYNQTFLNFYLLFFNSLNKLT